MNDKSKLVESADNATAFKEEIQNHEIDLQLFRDFLKENEEYIAIGGEPSFAVFLLIRLKKLAKGDKTWDSIPVVKPAEEA